MKLVSMSEMNSISLKDEKRLIKNTNKKLQNYSTRERHMVTMACSICFFSDDIFSRLIYFNGNVSQ